MLVHGSRKDFSRLQYKRCHLLRPDPTSNRHSRHGSKYGLVLIDHRVSRLQHSKEYSDCGKVQQTDLQNHSKHPFGYSMFFEHQSIGVGLDSRSHIPYLLSSRCRSPILFPRRFHNRHKFRQQFILAETIIDNTKVHHFDSRYHKRQHRQ